MLMVFVAICTATKWQNSLVIFSNTEFTGCFHTVFISDYVSITDEFKAESD